MEIFGIGTMELVVLMVLALIIVGPQKLPEIGRNIGRTVAEFKSHTDALKQTMSFDAPAPKPAVTYIPGTQVSNLPDERLSALQRYYGDREHELAAVAAATPVDAANEQVSAPEQGTK